MFNLRNCYTVSLIWVNLKRHIILSYWNIYSYNQPLCLQMNYLLPMISDFWNVVSTSLHVTEKKRFRLIVVTSEISKCNPKVIWVLFSLALRHRLFQRRVLPQFTQSDPVGYRLLSANYVCICIHIFVCWCVCVDEKIHMQPTQQSIYRNVTIIYT